MKRWQQWALGAVITLVVVLGTALGLLYARLDPSAYRARIEALASQAVGRDVEIRGPITLSVLPWPSIEFDNVRVVDSSGIGRRGLARADTVRVTARPSALLTGRLAVGTLWIKGLRLTLARSADGRNNWQGVIDAIAAGPGQALGAAPVKTENTPRRVIAGLPLKSMAVGAVKLRDAVIRYDDAETDRHWKLYDARLDTGRMTDGNPFRLETSGRLSAEGTDTVVRLHLVTQIEPHLSDRFYRFSDLGLNVLAAGSRVPGGEQEANLGASGDIDFNSGRFGLQDVTFQSAGLTVTGKIDGQGLNDRLSYYGRLTVLPFSPRSVMQQLEIAAPHTQSPNALRRAGFDAQFAGGAHSIRFRQIAARLDESRLTGSARIANFADPLVQFALALNALDIDHYLPPGSAEQASGSTSGSAGRGDAVDFALLRTIRFNGHLSIGALTAANLTLRRAEVSLAAARGVLAMDSLTAAAYGGRLDLSGRIDATTGQPRLALRGRMRHIALGGVMRDAVASKRLTGSTDFDIDLTASGRRVIDLKRSLGGRFALRLTNGAINGYDLAAAVADTLSAKAVAVGKSVTPITALSARFTLADGVAHNDDLLLVTPKLLARGAGRYSVPMNSLAYKLWVDPRPQDSGAASDAEHLPIVLDGSLLAPSPAIGKPEPRAAASQAPAAAGAADGAAATPGG